MKRLGPLYQHRYGLRWLSQRASVALLIAVSQAGPSPAQESTPSPIPVFESQTIDDQVEIGYGVTAGDVDGDGKTDLLLADRKQFVWYRNPDWKRFVMVDNLTPLDNVCIAARDLDGDGKVEVAVGALWNPGDTENSGSVHYLIPPADRTQLWTPVALHHEPTTHRMRWVSLGNQQYVLVVVPLHGRGNRNGEGAPVRVLAYHPPQDPREPWQTTLIDESLHMTHNLDVLPAADPQQPEAMLLVGREGARYLTYSEGTWESQPINRIEGGGEIRAGNASGRGFVATIEAMHGERLVVYPLAKVALDQQLEPTDRRVIDDSFQGGHAIAIGDLCGSGGDQIVAGWRLPNAAGEVGLKWYRQSSNGDWEQGWIDQGGMATEDAILVDLDGDKDLDVVAAGRATLNLKVYWNRAERQRSP